MIGYVKIMKQINALKDGEYLNIARLMENAFIRKRKIDLPRIIAFILSFFRDGVLILTSDKLGARERSFASF